MKNLLIFSIFFILINPCKSQTVTDVDGNIYNTITIGTQVWMAKNLRVTHYKNGIKIPLVIDGEEWITLTTPGFCWFDNDSSGYAEPYGALYNGYTIDTENLCPESWHVPSDAEWTILTDFLGGLDVAGGKLKEIGTTHWIVPNTGATDDFSFTALPGGSRTGGDGLFYDFGKFGYWWSSTKTNSEWGYVRRLGFMETGVTRNIYLWSDGFSIRCLKDNITSIVEHNNHAQPVIYPNPANDKILIKNIDDSQSSIMIFDLLGNLVLNKQIYSNHIDISDLENGVYLVRLINSKQTVIEKIVKQ
jgi:uncharacterized protein (TIGR02145 family)